MPQLDSFDAAHPASDRVCTDCGEHRGTMQFWTTPMDGEPDAALCIHCLLTAPGKFNGSPAVDLLRDHETVEEVYLNDNNNLIIETTSSLGTFHHVYYLESTLVANNASFTSQGLHDATATVDIDITGASEVFNSDGEFVYAPSVYRDVAKSFTRDRKL